MQGQATVMRWLMKESAGVCLVLLGAQTWHFTARPNRLNTEIKLCVFSATRHRGRGFTDRRPGAFQHQLLTVFLHPSPSKQILKPNHYVSFQFGSLEQLMTRTQLTAFSQILWK